MESSAENQLSTRKDRRYRLAVAWQNTAYNQPSHPGYLVGDGMAQSPRDDRGPLP